MASCHVQKVDNYFAQGLQQAEERLGFEGDGYVYLKNPLWWAGIGTCEGTLETHPPLMGYNVHLGHID